MSKIGDILTLLQRVQFRYTMNGFEQGDIDPHDTVPRRVLKFLLRSNMPGLRTRIMKRINEAFDQSLSKGKLSKDSKCPVPVLINSLRAYQLDWTDISVFGLAETIGLRMNCQVIGGDQLGNSRPFGTFSCRMLLLTTFSR